MKNLFATFPEWYIGDGIYSPFYKNQKVHLSFYLMLDEAVLSTENSCFFEQQKHADYRFCGEVIYVYADKNERLILLEAVNFRFFIQALQTSIQPAIGDFISGKGQVFVDDFNWADGHHQYPNLPSPFFNLEIKTILKVTLPAHYIHRYKDGQSYPTSLSAFEYADEDVKEIDDMTDEEEETVFYVLDMLFINEKIEQTFIP